MEDENMAEANHEVPMKVSAQGRTHLKELSQASSNSKSLIPQPQTLKSRPKSTPQTLEPKRTASASTSRPASTTRGHNRVNTITASSSFAAHRAPTSSSSRMPANKSLSSTVGPGTRPPSMKRPHSAASEPRKKVPPGVARPVTAFDTHDEGNNGSGIKNRKGRRSSLPFSFQAFPPTFSAGGHGGSFKDSTGIRALFSRGAIPEDSDCEELSSCISPRNSTLSPSPGRITDPKTPVISQNGPQKSFSSVNPKSSTSRRQGYKRQTSVPQKHSSQSRTHVPFLNKYSSVKAFNYSTGDEWDVNTKTKTMEGIVEALFSRMNQAGESSSGLKEAMELYKSQVNELKASNGHLMEANLSFRVEVETMRTRLAVAENTLKETERSQDIAMDDAERRYRFDLENARQRNMKELEESDSRHQDELRELKRRFERELDDEKAVRQREANQAQSQYAVGAQRLQVEVEQKDREIFRLQDDLKALREDMERERKKNLDLRQNLDTASNSSVTLESSIRALKARIEFLESGREEQSQSFERINQQMLNALSETNETKEKLRKEETLRRKLHNQVQELKGNIRVFCRVRPSLDHEPATGAAQFQYPDQSAEAKEICIQGPEERNSFGAVTRKNNFFSFDRVFEPLTQNAEVFDEISQLVQSALDGYNVCIFCYGQTGSGKTYTMSSPDGMIPRTVLQIYDTAKSLEDKGWTYTMEGNFVEVYNENLNDLLGSPEEMDKKKHEIRHDMQTCKTTITGATTVRLDSPEMVESILRRAATNRTVAATRVNERSSRSHSVFILKLIGHNAFTGERSEGTLNLVDLAGSERLSQSGVTGERLKETQNINRSLSCLGDVIAALGQGKEGGHIPYRNSKLTYLLQFSLGGNSKTLMFVMVSPLQNHLSETLTSLKFATKVHHTHIGTAKRQTRVRDA